MTLNEFVYSIAIKAKKEENFEFVESLKKDTNSKRAYFLKQELARNAINTDAFMQAFCVDIEEKPMIECCGFSVDECDYVLRSTKKLPKTMMYGLLPFSYVGPDDYSKPYTFTKAPQIKSVLRQRIIGKVPLYALVNDYLVLFNPVSKDLTKITVQGLLGDPDKILEFRCSNSSNCYSHDQEYPCSEDILEIIRKDFYNEFNILAIPSEDREVNVDDGQA